MREQADDAARGVATVQEQSAVRRLPEQLWTATGAGQRSQELTPLYVERFQGPLAGRWLTAHPFWEMILVHQGEGEMRTARPFPLRPGTVCLMPPGVAHVEASRQTDLLWIGLRGHRVDRLPRDAPLVALSVACVRLAITCWETARKGYGEIGPELDGWALVLFARLHQALGLRDDCTVHRLEETVAYLHTHFHEAIDVPTLAAASGYSEGYFYRAFKTLTGKTPVQYLTSLRVQEALRWLEHSDLPITQIAAAVGFPDAHYFTRIIKEYTGATPLAVRQMAACRTAKIDGEI